ncbi:MAG: hypothetical protein ABH882_07075 [Candidatus Omnitrophota bacterium]|nr:hypothetical protein [Candidatus Omnitrophota bacterium]MBU1928717.1 hypothetical protein [Candidatus Omnitrophota bacterium]MBU2034172.1 hypothetical protein [Candidatus Omnitrophota bacterium]MBU2221416.1 hypothetical protein [Candidatus Omnitrophota bacterium]MBU2257610.1 hypothetical protein [Candidatus Omnitrophota bacterium]
MPIIVVPKKITLLLLILSILCSINSSAASDWKELSSEHFILYYMNDENFSSQVLNKAENYYQRIASDLGYARNSNFWTWNNRAKIYIYPDHGSFMRSTGQPDWSKGMADYNKKEIVSFLGSGSFVESILPHEMTHLIFRDFVGFKGEIPLWLEEGIAQWEEEKDREMFRDYLGKYLSKNLLISLEELNVLDIRNIKKEDRLYLRVIYAGESKGFPVFLSGDNLVKVYYMESVSIVSFLIEIYGTDSFVSLCRGLREGKTFADALKSAYSPLINSMSELENKWIEYLRKF